MDFNQSSIPLMSIDGTIQEFDYVALLQEQEADYLAEESSASGTSNALTAASMYSLMPSPIGPGATTAEGYSMAAPSSSHSSGSSGAALPVRQRFERRGHTKSRRGCFNCKRRRIKCQETKPACGHCIKTGLRCEYPAVPQVIHQPQHQIPLFSLQDMRFFQHFLLRCYPHHPLGNESVWTHEIPCLSESHEYLMHAILGFAASDLLRQGDRDPSLAEAAITHRVKAIRAIKKRLAETAGREVNSGGAGSSGGGNNPDDGSRSPRPPSSMSSPSRSPPPPSSSTAVAAHCPPPTTDEGNALMAACFALTFQSVALDDGMAEYMTFVRGVVIVALQMWRTSYSSSDRRRPPRFLFRNFFGNDQLELLRPALSRVPPVRRDWSEAAAGAVRALEPLCRAAGEVEMGYWTLLLRMAEALPVSAFESYKAMSRHYGWWMQLPHEDFRRVIDPQSQVFVLLATHWLAVKQVMVTVTEAERRVAEVPGQQPPAPQAQAQAPAAGGDSEMAEASSSPASSTGGMDSGMARWLRHLNRLVEPAYRGYNAWPAWVEAELERDPCAFGRSR